jgi:amino acid adenylation domain-containing protein
MRRTLPELLESARSDHVSRTAVEDPRTGASLTFAQLGERSDRIGDLLTRAGVRHGDRVGLCAPKSVTSVAAIHGILMCGAAYVPVDAASPAARNAAIFNNCEAAAIVLSKSAADSMLAPIGSTAGQIVGELDDDLVIVSLRSHRTHEEVGARPVGPGDVAYILYTSGSTGTPKGVVHTHASARAFIDWCSDEFSPSPDDRFSSHAPFHFDLSILDLYVSLAAGAAVVLIDDETAKQPLRLASLIEERRISIWYSTPSALRLLAGYGKLERHDHSSLRIVLFAGEVFPVGAMRSLKAHWNRPRYFNLYGPTETNVCTFFEVPAVIDDRNAFPIGRVCAGDRARVIDAADSDVQPGEEGELLISGPTVMREYWNLPERTANAFLEIDGERWYRTGDVVRESAADGFIFLGRRDRMVKRRGFRIELGEIEFALARHPAIFECAVVAMPDDETGVRIEAALVANAEKNPSLVELKQFCADALPLYMVPDRFVFRASIPQTSTGKVDYQRLREEVL